MNDDRATEYVRAGLTASGRILVWTLAWAASLALARFGPGAIWGEGSPLSWVAIALNLAVGVGLIVAFTRFLRSLDELERKIQLDALGITFGAGAVAGFAYAAAQAAGLVTVELELALLVPLFLTAVFFLAIVAGNIRYR